MAGVRLLHRVHGQSANRVDAQSFQLLSRHHNLFTGYHATLLLQPADSRRRAFPAKPPTTELELSITERVHYAESVSISVHAWIELR
jgi:hypothetical protein